MIDFDYNWTEGQMRSWLSTGEPNWDQPFADTDRWLACIAGFEGDEQRRVSALIDAYWHGDLTTEAFVNRFEQGLWPADPNPQAPEDVNRAYAFGVPVDSVSFARSVKMECLKCRSVFDVLGPVSEPCPKCKAGRLAAPGDLETWNARAEAFDRLRKAQRVLAGGETSRIPLSSTTWTTLKAQVERAQAQLDAICLFPVHELPDTPVYLYGNDNGTYGFVAKHKVSSYYEFPLKAGGGVIFTLKNGQDLRKAAFLGVSTRTQALDMLNTKA